MKKVEQSELLALGAYEEVRPHFRARIIELKARRRFELGPHLSIVFENHDTVLSQIQEMLRTERISDERAIAHELETYNELVPAPGSLSATLFVEYTDKEERARMLAELATLRTHVHLSIGSTRARAVFRDQSGEEPERLPAVNYLGFELAPGAAAALRNPATSCVIEIDHPACRLLTELPRALREELAHDLDPA